MESIKISKKQWSKQDFFKTKQQIRKPSITQSVKGICTNIWYKLGGQSIMTRKASKDFNSLVILGKNYQNIDEAENYFKSLFWFTYRKQIKLPYQIKSDIGWGCLIRVGQMLLANSLKRFLQKKVSNTNQQNIVFHFLDDFQSLQGNYSFQRILQKGSQKFNLKAGDWFNISQICYILMMLQNSSPMKGTQQFKILYFNQTLIFLEDVFKKIGLKMCQCQNKKIICQKCSKQTHVERKSSMNKRLSNNSFQLSFQDLNIQQIQQEQQHKMQKKQIATDQQFKKQVSFDLLIIVSTRLSKDTIDDKNFEGLLDLMKLSSSMGAIGGVPDKALYFVGNYDQNIVYLDPHLVQKAVTKSNLSKQLHSFHCQNLRLIGRQKLDSSIAFAFYIRNLNDLSQLIQQIQKIKRKNPDAVPISYMWQNQFRDSGQFFCSNQFQMEQNSPDFSFIA